MTTTEKPTNVDLADIEWYHLDGTVCVAGFYAAPCEALALGAGQGSNRARHGRVGWLEDPMSARDTNHQV